MALFQFNFKTSIIFSEVVWSHHIILRCLPCNNDAQSLLAKKFKISPSVSLTQGIDSFGNIIQYGCLEDGHNFFEFESEGLVDVLDYRLAEKLNRIYLYESEFTTYKKYLRNLFKKILFNSNVSVSEKVIALSNILQQNLEYESGKTNIKTTAEDALAIGKGVCQDFAHCLIALCRFVDIPARYVSGFTIGEGFTHAWIEYYDDGFWYGYDPTRNESIGIGYIKLSHGRDYGDCPIERGVFRGIASQNFSIKVTVEQQ